MLTDPASGRLTAVSHQALAQADDEPGVAVDQELFLQQLETGTGAHPDMDALEADIRRARRVAGEAARAAGAVAIAVATPVLAAPQPELTPKDRYRTMVERFGDVARDQLVCGMHVHVDVASEDEAVAAFDRMRPWFPVLLAISANSPYWYGRDTGYASWRAQVWKRWPTAGPTEPFGDAEGYRRATAALQETGAALDDGMLYFDARPSRRYPTLEIRAADMCTEVEDVVLLAALGRALVSSAAAAWAAGEPLRDVRTDMLRAATWRAARYGLGGDLVHPVTGRLASAREAVAALVQAVAGALDEAGDRDRTAERIEQLFAGGSGAARQRAVATAHDDDLRTVVADLGRRTEDSWEHR